MTEDEYIVYGLRVRITVRDLALGQLVAAVAALPGGRPSLVAWASQVRARSQGQTIPGLDPAESDLVAAEYQEALQELFDGLGL